MKLIYELLSLELQDLPFSNIYPTIIINQCLQIHILFYVPKEMFYFDLFVSSYEKLMAILFIQRQVLFSWFYKCILLRFTNTFIFKFKNHYLNNYFYYLYSNYVCMCDPKFSFYLSLILNYVWPNKETLQIWFLWFCHHFFNKGMTENK